MMTQQGTYKHSIFAFWPNVVGYLRLILLFFGLYLIKSYSFLAFILFAMSSMMDAFDGFLARRFGQISHFGKVFDYTIDRISVVIYVFILAQLYSEYWIAFCFILVLDIASHLFYLFVSLMERRGSHKENNPDNGWLLNFYYQKPVLFLTCFAYEAFFGALFLHRLYLESSIVWAAMYLFLPGFIFKVIVHWIKLINSCSRLAKLDYFHHSSISSNE